LGCRLISNGMASRFLLIDLILSLILGLGNKLKPI
jgi:hypothetical protein